jgi:hypothetical protein
LRRGLFNRPLGELKCQVELLAPLGQPLGVKAEDFGVIGSEGLRRLKGRRSVLRAIVTHVGEAQPGS